MNQKEIFSWRVNNFPDYPDILIQGLVLAEEAGEVARAIAKRHQGIRGTHEEWSADLQKECAQTLISLLCIAELEGFDLWQVAENYWPTLAKRNFNGDNNG